MNGTDHFIQIYRSRGKTYHEMISFEDTDDNLRPALQSITPFTDQRVLDLGTGTGRLPLLFPESEFIGLDLHENMLLENQANTREKSTYLVQANMKSLPFDENCFDSVTAGWAIGHFTGWYPNDWREQVDLVLEQTVRVLKPSGWMIILETLSTGSLNPAPPNPSLANYYSWLENQWGFSSMVVQTDYQFETLEQAEWYSQFFFGEALAKLVRKNHWVRLPEWTGIWSKQFKT
jgi:ubiquinone/menaquinone biosynthesis C-methylase UbiE